MVLMASLALVSCATGPVGSSSISLSTSSNSDISISLTSESTDSGSSMGASSSSIREKHIITYDLNNSDATIWNDTQEVYKNEQFTLYNPFYDTKIYAFNGWFYNGNELKSGLYPYNEDITVKGNWTYLGKTITYIVNNSEADVTNRVQKVIPNQAFTLQDPLYNENDFIFLGWYIGETKISSGIYTYEDSITITGKWKDKWTN